MRRGTQSAELFGKLLHAIRMTGLKCSMRDIGDKIGAPAATVSQIEKGQRALKEPKIALWAHAFDVKEEDLHYLWMLCQGQILVEGDQYAFYTDLFGRGAINYLADQIEDALHNLLPDKNIKMIPATTIATPLIVFSPFYRVPIPLLQKPTPIVRRRTTSVSVNGLEDLIEKLSGPERERVRGYIEAMLENKEK